MICPIHGEDCDYGKLGPWARSQHLDVTKYPSQGPIVPAKVDPEDPDPDGWEADRAADRSQQ